MLYVISTLLGLALLAADQAVKHWITANLPLDATHPLVPGLVQLRTVHNYGAAWSSFSGQRWFLIILTAAIMAAVAYFLVRRIVRHPAGVIAGFMVLSGGLGNILDRARLGYVVDMFDLQFMNYPVFNVADICIVCGCILGMLYYLFLYDKTDGKKPDAEEATEESNGTVDDPRT